MHPIYVNSSDSPLNSVNVERGGQFRVYRGSAARRRTFARSLRLHWQWQLQRLRRARQPAVNKHRPTTERRAPAGDMLIRYINVRALTARCRRAGAKSAIVYSTDV